MQFAKAMRYIIAIYPLLAVLSGTLLEHLYEKYIVQIRNTFTRYAVCLTIVVTLISWPIMFMSIYAHPNTRVAASDWIYANIPTKSTLVSEHWDDPLPMSRGDLSISRYTTEQLPMFNLDNTAKWREITKQLEHTDYIVLSSNRVYGGTGQVPNRFPLTTRYYQLLFDNSLGFTLIHQEISRPNLAIPNTHLCIHIPGFSYGMVAKKEEACGQTGISIVDDYVDETFTVYDHPKVLVFKNEKRLSATALLALIEGN
jgi:hypothetical protein